LPGISVSVEEMLSSLQDLAGSAVLNLITKEPDPEIARIVNSWPVDIEAERARRLGFKPNADFREILQEHIDELTRGE
ncbi:MAG: hypothetical protein OXN84_06220, partial [Albidovulum sp.]|nr:hypothetical protein [Albidovulum sp.]